jgi:hypothetical protein
VPLEMTKLEADGLRRVASNAFRYKAKGFSVWFAAGSDLRHLRQHFPSFGVAELSLSHILAAGFSYVRCADPEIQGDHANVYASSEWSAKQELAACRILATRANLIITPSRRD